MTEASIDFALWNAYFGGHNLKAMDAFLLQDPRVLSDFEYGGLTPLSEECRQRGSVEVVKLLLKHQADVNIVDGDGWAALHYAAWWGHVEVAELLLVHGAKVNALNSKGHTPIVSAIGDDNLNMIKVLIRYGADLNLPKNLLDLNTAKSNPDLFKYLQGAIQAQKEHQELHDALPHPPSPHQDEESALTLKEVIEDSGNGAKMAHRRTL